MGRCDTKTIHRSYSIFFVIRTSLAIQVPLVDYAPQKSFEQLGLFAVFVEYQLLYVTENSNTIEKECMDKETILYVPCSRIWDNGSNSDIGSICTTTDWIFWSIQFSYTWFICETYQNGNSLVDSVAEHPPASGSAYFQYLHHVCSVAPVGFIITLYCWFYYYVIFQIVIWYYMTYFVIRKLMCILHIIIIVLNHQRTNN